MNSKHRFALVFAAGIAAAMAGCSRHAAAPQTLAADKIPAVVNQAFDQAPDETKEQATSYVTALQGQDAPTAFAQLKKLSTENNLNPQQRRVIAQAMQTTFKQLQDAAQNGNAAAKAAMHQYLSTR
jgi:hypothetical protein